MLACAYMAPDYDACTHEGHTKERKEKTMPFGVNLLRSPVLYRLPSEGHIIHTTQWVERDSMMEQVLVAICSMYVT